MGVREDLGDRAVNRTDNLADCRWPVLSPRHSAALRAAVSFIFERFEPQAVIATGTIVRGGGDRASDLDLIVVHAAPFKQRLQRWFGDVPAEIFVNPLSAIRGYFDIEHRGGRPVMAHMIATGFPVFGAQACADLQAEAAVWLAKRSTLTAEEQTVARYIATELLDDGEDVAERDPAMASALLGEAVLAMLRYYLRAQGVALSGRKRLLAEVESLDPEVGRLARGFFGAASVSDRLAAARSLADRCIQTRGFFEWESEQVTVEIAD